MLDQNKPAAAVQPSTVSMVMSWHHGRWEWEDPEPTVKALRTCPRMMVQCKWFPMVAVDHYSNCLDSPKRGKIIL